MNVEPRDVADLKELRRRVRKESDAKQRDRYRAVLLALQGAPTSEIQDKLDRSKNFVQRWVYAYRDHGLSAVRARKPPGIAPKLPREQEQAFLERITNTTGILRGRDIVTILQQEFGVRYTLQGAYDLLHRLNYEPLRPRPVNPKKDPEAQAAWKQDAPLLSSTCETTTPPNMSNSGSKTNAGSDRKGA
jgi:transposase